MSQSPQKKPKKQIHDFFKPYLKSVTPAKRPSPSLEEDDDLTPISKAEFEASTPKSAPRTQRRSNPSQYAHTSASSACSPLSAPGSRASLSIRSKVPHAHSKTPIAPPSTYTHGQLFGTPSKIEGTPNARSNGFSFADLPSSTQAVVKDGMVVAVRDSDEETDSLDSESLDGLFGFTKKDGHNTATPSTSPGEDEANLEAVRRKTLSMWTHGRSEPLIGKDRLREMRARESAFTFSMDALLNDHYDEQKIDDSVKAARAQIEAVNKELQADVDVKINKNLLAAITHNPDGEARDVDRFIDAVDRTEALTTELGFLFFGEAGLQDWSDETPVQYNFPAGHIPQALWSQADEEQRSRAYTSGHMARLASQRQLDDEALMWTFDNVVLEQQDAVRQAYIDCLHQASSSWTRNNVGARNVQLLFQTLGADTTSVQDSVEIRPRHQILGELEKRDPKYLLAVLDLFEAICLDMDFQALSKLTSMICRLAIDSELMSDGQVGTKVERLLEVLLSIPDVELRTHVADRILADLGHFLTDSTLQAHLLSHILPTSRTASRVRLLLAHVYLLGPTAFQPLTLHNPTVSLETLAQHISNSADFDTRRRRGTSTLDYVAFRSRIHILDIAISDGGRPTTFPTRASEHAFNKSVDRLADILETMYTAIIDTGASHMTRTEAKDDLKSVKMRLLHSVRTESRPKRHIFDGGVLKETKEVEDQARKKDFMKNFLARKKGKAADRDDAGEIDADERQIRAQLGMLGD